MSDHPMKVRVHSARLGLDIEFAVSDIESIEGELSGVYGSDDEGNLFTVQFSGVDLDGRTFARVVAEIPPGEPRLPSSCP